MACEWLKFRRTWKELGPSWIWGTWPHPPVLPGLSLAPPQQFRVASCSAYHLPRSLPQGLQFTAMVSFLQTPNIHFTYLLAISWLVFCILSQKFLDGWNHTYILPSLTPPSIPKHRKGVGTRGLGVIPAVSATRVIHLFNIKVRVMTW